MNTSSKFTAQQLIRWTVDITPVEFGVEIYGRDEETCHRDSYVGDKYQDMQTKLVVWMGSLDPNNKERFSRSVISHSYEDGNIKPSSPLKWGKK